MAGRLAENASQAPGAGQFGISHLESFLLRRRTHPEKIAWLLGALAAATLARFAVGAVVTGIPLLFYLPAVLIVTLVAGWRYGIVSLAIATPLGMALFGQPTLFTGPSPVQTAMVTLTVWVIICGVIVAMVHFVRVALNGARYNETRFRKLLDAVSTIVWTTDREGRVLSPQPLWTEITGMAWPDYAGHGWLKAIHPEDQARLRPNHTEPGMQYDADTELRVWHAASADWRWYHARAVPVRNLTGQGEWITALREIHDQKLSRDQRDLVIAELRHRMKNLVAIIDALAKGSRQRDEPAMEDFIKKFSGRLHALGAAADLVLAGSRVSIECHALLRATLAPFLEEKSQRIGLEGRELQLSEQTGGTLGLAIHEMATNALKYGALSVPGGTVSVRWSVAPCGEGSERVTIEWKEHGGPRPVPPNREGFGTRLIRSVPSREREGDVAIEYQPDGLYYRITFVRTAEGPPAAEPKPVLDAAE
ncbi:MAG TPA: HWE histidine kinase domain-containing protein [Rhizomicrobium sp.]|nr:HWE histidine kinase domain-containing protein [Rhizomicrobium sp.]